MPTAPNLHGRSLPSRVFLGTVFYRMEPFLQLNNKMELGKILCPAYRSAACSGLGVTETARNRRQKVTLIDWAKEAKGKRQNEWGQNENWNRTIIGTE